MSSPNSAPASGAEIRAWALYDFANSAFTTLVITFVYSAWFAESMAGDVTEGARLWSRGMAASSILVALLAPLLGAHADRAGRRSVWLRRLTLATIAGTIALGLVPPGSAYPALLLLVLTNACYELGSSVYNSFLPSLAAPGTIGRVSALGWASGYAGGLLCLLAGLALIYGGILPERDGWSYRGTNFLVAVWFLVFSIPAMTRLREPPPLRAADRFRLRDGWRRVRPYPQPLRLLAARLFYNDGLVAIIALGGIYASATFGFGVEQLLVFGVALNVAAASGALLFGQLDDRWGGKPAILISLAGLACGTLLAVFARSPSGFWIASIVIGLMLGPNQSASRSLLARMIPPDRTSEFYGLYALSGKLTAFAAPLIAGEVAARSGSLRWGMASILAFFAVGGLLAATVDERAGAQRAATQGGDAP